MNSVMRKALSEVMKVRLLGAVRQAASTSSSLTSEEKDASAATSMPKPSTTPPSELQFDEVTHTGQAWDQEDYRLARFTYLDKQVNPNVAMNLVAEVPPTACHHSVVSCDGGGGPLGHPKIYLNLDKPGTHACGYCGLRFYKDDVEQDGSTHIQV